MNPFSQVAAALLKSRKVLITTHVNPDGDAVGSLLGLGLALRSRDMDVTMYLEHSIPAFLRFLPGSHLPVHALNGVDAFEVAVILDCGDLYRVGKEAPRIGRIRTLINIDHHVSNRHFGDYRLVFPSSSATSEIVYHLLREMGHALSRDEAVNLYTGIITDTGSFCYGNTSRDSFLVAAGLLEAGVDPQYIASAVYGQYHRNRLHLLQRALGSLEVFLDGRVGMITLLREDMTATRSGPEDVRGFVDFVSYVPGVEVAVLVRELDGGKAEVSLRSTGKCDVSRLASTMGGGGHRNAAGFSYRGDIHDLKRWLVQCLEPLL